MASVALRSSRSCSYPTASESSELAFARRVGEVDPTGVPKPRLLDRVRAAGRARHYSRRTEKAYVAWIRRYIFFHDTRHPAEMGAPELTRFLSSLAVDGTVAASNYGTAGTRTGTRARCYRPTRCSVWSATLVSAIMDRMVVRRPIKL
jgi:hypothetical protein